MKEGVMKFINTIAEIVHSVANKYSGKSNKNLGDSFLMVWKFRDSDIENVLEFDEYGQEKVDIHLK